MLCVSPLWLILSLSANTPAHTSGITIRFYRCLPTLRSIHPDSLSDLRCQPHQQDVACFPIYSIFDIWFLINQFWEFSFEISFYKVHKRSAISSSGSGDVGLRRILTLILYLNLKRVMMQQKRVNCASRQLFLHTFRWLFHWKCI